MQNAFSSPSVLLLPAVRPISFSTTPTDVGLQWLGVPVDLAVAEEELELRGFHLYAVEKWIVERNRPIVNLVVQTGDPTHKIKVTAFRVSPLLSSQQAKRQWETAMTMLRQGGTRPVQTEHGVIFTTSLAHFRSDYTIVQIPDGNFLSVKTRLYANINLLRLGCTGTRGGAVGLEEPSEATKERFIGMYQLPEFSTSPLRHVEGSEPTNQAEVPVPSTSNGTSKHKDEQSHLSPPPSGGQPSTTPLLPSPNISRKSSMGSRRTSVEQSRSYSLPSPTAASFSLHVHASPSRSSHVHRDAESLLPVESSKSPSLFPLMVLELGKLIQAGLMVCGALKATTTSYVQMDVTPSRHSISAGPTSKVGVRRRPTGSRSSSVSGIDSVLTGQSSLNLMDSKSRDFHELDGLLCDVTISGIQTWVDDIGAPLIGMEPLERICDPIFVSALLSTVLTMRNKTHALGYQNVPKDPFLNPHAFLRALSASTHRLQSHSNQSSPLPSPLPHAVNSSGTSLGSQGYFGGSQRHGNQLLVPKPLGHSEQGKVVSEAPSAPSLATTTHATPSYLTRSVIQEINSHFTRHSSPSDAPAAARKVGRAIFGRLDDLGKRSGQESNVSAEEDHGWNSDGPPSGGEGYHSSSSPLLSGIGTFASGLGFTGIGSKSGKASDILEPQLDLETLVKGIIGKDKAWKTRNEKMAKRRSRGLAPIPGDMSPGSSKEKDRDAKEHERDMAIVSSVGGCIRGLWSGRCGNIIVLREVEAERERQGRPEDSKKSDSHRRRLYRGRPKLSPASDEETGDRSDPRSSDPEDSHSALAPWGGKVRGKIDSWTKISRKKPQGSLDLSMSPSKGSLGRASDVQPEDERRPTLSKRALSASPTLNPTIRIGSSPQESDVDIPIIDDAMTSSGKSATPMDHKLRKTKVTFSDGRTPRAETLPSAPVAKAFGVGLGPPPSVHDQNVLGLPGQKRPWGNRLIQTRVSSWSDPISAREVIEDDTNADGRVKADQASQSHSSLRTSERIAQQPNTRLGSNARRRRSFHDLDTLRNLPVLSPSRMKIDVELAGHYLVLFRRQEHLRNIVASLRILTEALPLTNAFLRSHVDSQSQARASAEIRTKVIADIEADKSKADAAELATDSVTYASRQFNIPQLYNNANSPRQRTFAMREAVFGTGGRRVPTGVHGAHGPYNRVQWTLDGKTRLVDALGRTESEVDEEEELDPDHNFVQGRLDEGEDVTIVQHRAIKPMWLLGWFKGLGGRWTSAAPVPKTPSATQPTSANDDHQEPRDPANPP